MSATFPPSLTVLHLSPSILAWIPAVLIALIAGIVDWRFRRIPNWLTVSGFAAGLLLNTIFFRLSGLKTSLLGAALGLALLLPFVLIRSLGAGDFKLGIALGACLGPRPLMSVLVVTILVAGLMALAVVIFTGRLLQTLRNIAHVLAAFLTLKLPGHDVSLDNPQSTKIPFGVAMSLSVLLCAVARVLGKL